MDPVTSILLAIILFCQLMSTEYLVYQLAQVFPVTSFCRHVLATNPRLHIAVDADADMDLVKIHGLT